MSSRWSRIRALMIKETRQLLRDRRALAIALGLPVALIVVFGYGVSLDVGRVQLLVCDRDHTLASRALVRRFVSSGYFTVAGRVARDEEIEDTLRTGRARAALVIPRGYDRAIARHESAPLQLVVDGVDSNTASTVRGHALTLFQESAIDLLEDRLQTTGMEARRSRGTRSLLPVEFHPRVLYNPNLESRNYLVPGLIAVLMTLIGVLLPSISIVREEELGTLESLRVSPLGAWEVLLGKLAPYAAISMVDLVLVVAASRVFFGIELRGSLAVFALGSILLLVAALGLGMLISTVASTQQGAMAASFIGTILPVIYLSGFIFTLRSIPGWLDALSHLVPARYYLAIVRGVVQKGVGFEALAVPLAQLAVYSGLLLVAGALAIRRKLS